MENTNNNCFSKINYLLNENGARIIFKWEISNIYT